MAKKKMYIKRVSPLTGVTNLLAAFTLDNPYPDKMIRDEIGDITVDTSLPKDTNIWETGIERRSIEDKWVIVEQYKNEKDAEQGHKSWVARLKANPGMKLKDIDQWSLWTLGSRQRNGV